MTSSLSASTPERRQVASLDILIARRGGGAPSKTTRPSMSEPKTAAQTTTEILPGLHHFKILDDRIKTQSDAYALVQAGRVVLIDPLPLDPARLARLGRVEAIVLGSPSHQRSAWRYRKELNAKVHAPEGWKDLD